MNQIRYIDLFSGIGGFHTALSSLGAECVFASEIDKDCQDIYEKNYGMRPKGDITKIHSTEIPYHEILCAGFPCQAFSISGKQLGFADDRGALFFDIMRIAEYHRPKVLLLENVKNLRSHDNGKTLNTILSTIKGLGYKVHWKLLNASHFGVPQKRERIYIVAMRADLLDSSFTFPDGAGRPTRLADILITEGTEEYIVKSNNFIFNEKKGQPFVDFPKGPIRIGTVNKGGQGERIYSIHGHAITLSASGGGIGAKTGLYLAGGVVRRLAPRECARLMGFPDSFILHEKKNVAYKQFGNSVAVPVVKAIAERIMGQLLSDAPVWVDEWIMLPAETEARITTILDSASSRKKSIAAGGWKHFVLQWVHVEKEDEYRKTLDKAIEKMKKKAEIRHELPAAIDVVGFGQEVYKPCPHGVQAKVGSGYCTHYCSHRAEAEQWGKKVYCWYPEYRRRQPLPLTNHQILQGRDE